MRFTYINNPTKFTYINNPTYLDRQALANCVDPDKRPQNMATDQGLHCLPLIKQFLDILTCSKMDFFFFQILDQLL